MVQAIDTCYNMFHFALVSFFCCFLFFSVIIIVVYSSTVKLKIFEISNRNVKRPTGNISENFWQYWTITWSAHCEQIETKRKDEHNELKKKNRKKIRVQRQPNPPKNSLSAFQWTQYHSTYLFFLSSFILYFQFQIEIAHPKIKYNKKKKGN